MEAVPAVLALLVVAHAILHVIVLQHLRVALVARPLVHQAVVADVQVDAQVRAEAVVAPAVAEAAVAVVPAVVPAHVEVGAVVRVVPLVRVSAKAAANLAAQESVEVHHVAVCAQMFVTEDSVMAVAKVRAKPHVRGHVSIHVTSPANIGASNFYGRNQI